MSGHRADGLASSYNMWLLLFFIQKQWKKTNCIWSTWKKTETAAVSSKNKKTLDHIANSWAWVLLIIYEICCNKRWHYTYMRWAPSLSATSCFSLHALRQPITSTFRSLHVYLLTDAGEINFLGAEIWYQTTGHPSILDSMEAIRLVPYLHQV